MWTRAQLKINAKESLKRYYWIGFVVCLITGAIGGLISSVGTVSADIGEALSSDPMLDDNLGMTLLILSIFGIAFSITMALSFAYTIFVGNIIDVGKKHFFLSGREQTPQFSSLFVAFRRGRYSNTLRVTFLTRLYILLWTLLFIIPGIIKGYQYCMVHYIMAENPDISTSRAIEISTHMTDGDKFNIFVLELSFWGWYLLGFLACCIGLNFVNPYYEATFAELYGLKRQEALDSGFVSPNELPGFNN